MRDIIYKSDAIDIGRRATVDTNPSHFDSHQKFEQFMDDAEISSFGRWQWANGFNTALTAISIDLKQFPSAEPEIIRCRDCKHWYSDADCGMACELTNMSQPEDGFCNWAERKEE